MDISQMKNIVVLKNFPSNIVDEAIVVLKPHKKIKKMQYVKNGPENGETKQDNKYIVKEAEMLINNYINEIEKHKNRKRENKWKKKYNIQKYISFSLAFIAIIEFILI